MTESDDTEVSAAGVFDGDSSVEGRVQLEFDRALSQHLLQGRGASDLGQVVLAGLTVWIFWGSVPPKFGLGWLALVAVLAGIRASWRKRAAPGIHGPLRLRAAVRRDVMISAALWVIFAVQMVGQPVQELAVFLIIVSGLIAAGTSTLVADRQSFAGFLGILILSVVLAVSFSGLTRDHVSLLLLIGLFVPFMLAVHARANAVLEEQIRSRARLRFSEAETAQGRDFLNALVANAPVPIVVLDREHHVLRANPAFEHATGFSWGEVHGKDLAPLLSDDRDEGSVAGFLGSIREGARSIAELRLRRKDGAHIWMRLSGTMAGRQAADSTILVGEDVTEQVAAREAQDAARIEAEKIARAKSSFLASMSHEIRTPMNGILGMIELLLETPLNEEQRRSIRVVQSSAGSLLRILNDVLDVSKIEADQLDLEEIDFDLHCLLADTARVFAPQAGMRGTELVVDIDPSVPQGAHGDPVRFRQIVNNLLSNAVKFTTGGEIVLSARSVVGAAGTSPVRFGVRDTGIGIASEKQEQVFRAFEQADSSTTRVHGGTGLGLSIARRLVALMGGYLEVTSEEGVGSDFYFELTLPPASEAGLKVRRLPAVQLEGRRVLVLDDNSTARRISREVLESEGVLVDVAASVDEAIQFMKAVESVGGYDAVVLDHLMPMKDGFDFAREVRDDATLTTPRMLMLTSSAASRSKGTARELGIGAYLAKPVARVDLVRVLSSLLGQAKLHSGPERRLITQDTLYARPIRTAARILLAEDNAVNQQVAFALLTKRGYEVDVVENGRLALDAAVEAASERPYALVLMDIQMPEMDGLEATRLMRARPELKTLPIVALTAHAFQEERDRTVEAGMNDFLAKPFKPAALFDIVERWVAENDGPPDDLNLNNEPIMDDEPQDPVPVDIESFRAMMREVGVEEVVDQALDVYRQEAPSLFGRIATAVEAADAEAVRQAAHSLKSSSGNIRANGLAERLQRLEDLGLSADPAAASAFFPEVVAEYQRVMAYLSTDLERRTD